jgi:hypothetical protein
MAGTRVASRVGLLVAAVCALGMLSAPAWASTLVPPQPTSVYPAQCHQGGGIVVHNTLNGNDVWRCVGGRYGGQDIQF